MEWLREWKRAQKINHIAIVLLAFGAALTLALLGFVIGVYVSAQPYVLAAFGRSSAMAGYIATVAFVATLALLFINRPSRPSEWS